jgi:hypothetical protein
MPTVLGSDNYTRANNASSWGTSSGGDVWTAATGNGTATIAIASNLGTVTSASGTQANLQYLGTKTIKDCDMRIKAKASTVSTSSFAIVLRGDGSAANYYRAFLGSDFEIQKSVASAFTTLASTAFSGSNNTYYWIRFSAFGNLLAAKIWQDGSTEPAAWTLSIADATFSSGQYGVRGAVPAGVTVSFFSVEVDSVPRNICDGSGGVFG